MINIMIDKDFTTMSNLQMVETQIAEFVKRNTPQDIFDAFIEAFPSEKFHFIFPEVIACNGDAYCSDCGEARKTHYAVTLVVKACENYFELNVRFDNDMKFMETFGADKDGDPIKAYDITVYRYGGRI